MFSPELMKFLMKYQMDEQKPSRKYVRFSSGGIAGTKKPAAVWVRTDKF